MSQYAAGTSTNPEVEVSDDGRETPPATSSGSNSPDPNTATPGAIVRGGDDDDQ